MRYRSTLAVFGLFCCAALFVGPGLCCLSKEYETTASQCCPMCHQGLFCCAALFVGPGLCCLSKEYETTDSQCCPMCHQGTVVRRDCTRHLGTRCVACVNGTFMNQPNDLTNCFPCTPCDKGPGLFAQQDCTVTKDTVCDVLPGYFCTLMDETGCSLAQKHTPCDPGHRIERPGTSRANTVCESCPPGYFSLEGVNCTVWTTCSETEVEVKEGSASSDVVCGAASSPRYGLISVLISIPLTIVGLVIRGALVSKKTLEPPDQSDGHTPD